MGVKRAAAACESVASDFGASLVSDFGASLVSDFYHDTK